MRWSGGRAGRPGWTGEGMSPIAAHPDVRRMLMTMRGLTAASRAICYACAFAADMARAHRRGGLAGARRALTPIAKAFSTDVGFDVASLGVQVHGGMGFIEETGAAQTLRDSRIAADLRRHQRHPGDRPGHAQAADGGRRGRARLHRRAARDRRAEPGGEPARFRRAWARASSPALDDLEAATAHLLALLEAGRTAEALAGATPYLRLFGLAAGGAYLAKGALASLSDPGAEAALRIATARFFAERLVPETAALRIAVVEGAEAVLGLDPALLAG